MEETPDPVVPKSLLERFSIEITKCEDGENTEVTCHIGENMKSTLVDQNLYTMDEMKEIDRPRFQSFISRLIPTAISPPVIENKIDFGENIVEKDKKDCEVHDQILKVENDISKGETENFNQDTLSSINELLLKESAITEDKTELVHTKSRRAAGNKYFFVRTIGQGNFAKVKLAKHVLTKKFVAIKVIDRRTLDKSLSNKLTKEIAILKQLNHPNIVKLYELIERKDWVYMVMEYCSGGELFDYLVHNGSLREKEAKVKFRQMVSAMQYCHSKKIAHRDLKAENILLSKHLEICIADFGFATHYEDQVTLSTFCGSPPYAAPELLMGKKYIGPKADTWSLGIILFSLVSGRLPFDGKTLAELRTNVLNLRYEVPYFLTNECVSLLQKMLVIKPEDRATLNQLLKDRWLRDTKLPPMKAYREPANVELDESRIKTMVDEGYSRDYVINSLNNKKFNDGYATYHLLEGGMEVQERVSHENLPAQIKTKEEPVTATNRFQVTAAPVSVASTVLERVPKNTTNKGSEEQQTASTNVVHILRKMLTLKGKKTAETSITSICSAIDSSDSHYFDSMGTDSTMGRELQRQLQKQLQAMLPNDPNMSLTKSSNQQVLLETLNHMSISKSSKAGMFKPQELGRSQSQPKPFIDKGSVTAAPILLRPAQASSKMATREVVEAAGNVVEVAGNVVEVAGKSSKMAVNSVKSVGHAAVVVMGAAVQPITTAMISGTMAGALLMNNQETHIGKLSSTDSKSVVTDKDKMSVATDYEETTTAKKEDLSLPQHNNTHAQTLKKQKIQHEKPRVERFAVSLNTVSSKKPDKIMKEIVRALDLQRIKYEYLEKYLLVCCDGNIQWEMEVCSIGVMGLHGVRMKRIFGSSFVYNTIISKVIKEWKL